MIRFAIIKQIGDEEQPTGLEYNKDQILERIQLRVREHLVRTETWRKHSWSADEIAMAVEKAWGGLVDEFMMKTVTIA